VAASRGQTGQILIRTVHEAADLDPHHPGAAGIRRITCSACCAERLWLRGLLPAAIGLVGSEAPPGSHGVRPVTLELGGKDPMVVLRDANLERAANAAVWGALQNAGQTCISVERVYVEAHAYGPFVARVVDKVKRLRQGAPGEAGQVDLGTVTSLEQVEVIEEQLRDAVEKGARIETGGSLRADAGRFFEPTMLTNVDHSMKIMRDETFGPILPIMRVQDEEEAIRLANDSTMGLDSEHVGGDASHAERVARRIQCGAVVVNDALANYLALEIPIGGIKDSGVVARHGKVGIQKFCRRQNMVVSRLALNREVYYFPYTKA
jgi:acyl-CoA reductase-like NAD-dependent aldehyde dehydrogenase